MEETNKLDIKVELSIGLLAKQLKKIYPEWAMAKCEYAAKNANLRFGKEMLGFVCLDQEMQEIVLDILFGLQEDEVALSDMGGSKQVVGPCNDMVRVAEDEPILSEKALCPFCQGAYIDLESWHKPEELEILYEKMKRRACNEL